MRTIDQDLARQNNGVVGLVLVGLGLGVTVAGVALVVPVCAAWSRTKWQHAFDKGKKSLASGFDAAFEKVNEMASKAQEPLNGAAKAARHGTAVAAGAIESAAHYIKEHVQ